MFKEEYNNESEKDINMYVKYEANSNFRKEILKESNNKGIQLEVTNYKLRG